MRGHTSERDQNLRLFTLPLLLRIVYVGSRESDAKEEEEQVQQ
jgi:hypothetical protein